MPITSKTGCFCRRSGPQCKWCAENARWERIWQERGYAAQEQRYYAKGVDPYRTPGRRDWTHLFDANNPDKYYGVSAPHWPKRRAGHE